MTVNIKGIGAIFMKYILLDLITVKALDVHVCGTSLTSFWVEKLAPMDSRSLTISVCPDSAACASGVYPAYIDNDTINTNNST